MTKELINSLQQFGTTIPQADAGLIASAFTLRTYQEGETLFRGGTVCKEMFFIYEGVVRIASINETGNEVNFFFVREQALCTILDSFQQQTVTDSHIIAACPVRVGVVSKTQLDNLYHQLPYLQPLITHISQQLLIHKINLRNSYLSMQDSASRYKLFLELQADIALRVSLNNIASYLGITPQSLSRIHRNLR
ncbi:cAMP-binding domain of CRP or a regulatory subunit of cAMP-dependent protein kinases [Filimonas lacunae]|uniref:cAMP-binding domain of CRP or a regulatory subunit of cAMP-dependent protein kinases n=1 Tax=Filimonas lacunae TaxID=477680 RepID=A0A173MB32_9BACT|nr:Crp/Fnr family transcriptional regulator [Filimonas lacunae]BAV04737.1 Crp/Fnr family transcriptional regulator [Filimonas lacunae]SIT32227.1 cAMP-binding domain of CRP or a regulatory subunit of cAMP-dependent protein kinases [Filimonas lacunae]